MIRDVVLVKGHRVGWGFHFHLVTVIVQRLVDFLTLLNAMEALIESSRNGDQQIAIEEIIHQCRAARFHQWNDNARLPFCFFFFVLRLAVVEFRLLLFNGGSSLLNNATNLQIEDKNILTGNVCERLTGIGPLIFCLFAASRRQYFLVNCVDEGLRALSLRPSPLFLGGHRRWSGRK